MSMDLEEPLVSDEARSKIGSVMGRMTGTAVKKEFQRWAAAVNDLNPLYFDEEYAKSKGYRDVIAPPMYVQYVVLGVYELDLLAPDGIPAALSTGDISLPKCPRRMAGGEDLSFYEPIYDGDTITMVRTCTDIVEKHGRSGAFVLVSASTTYTRHDGTLVAEVKELMIARP